MKVKQGKSVIWLFLKINLSTNHINEKVSSRALTCRELAIDMVVHGGIFKFNQITLFPCFTFIPKLGASFYSEALLIPVALRLLPGRECGILVFVHGNVNCFCT